MKKLTKSFYFKESVSLAQKLLGCVLVRRFQGHLLKGKIVETEAYLGVLDECCHSFRGRRTQRTKTMYLPAGHAYIYFTYGKHHCFNIVTGNTRQPEAVLIRALEPLSGIFKMKKNRNKQEILDLTTGPGKLCQALCLDRSLDRENLLESERLFLLKGRLERGENMATDFRIGLPNHLDHAFLPLRFYIRDNPFVSVLSSL